MICKRVRQLMDAIQLWIMSCHKQKFLCWPLSHSRQSASTYTLHNMMILLWKLPDDEHNSSTSEEGLEDLDKINNE